MPGITFTNIDQCRQEIDRVFRDSPHLFGTTADRVEIFLSTFSLRRCLKEGCLDQVVDLRNQVTRYKVQLKMQEFQRKFDLGSEISYDDVMDCLYNITKYSIGQEVPNEVRQLFNLAKKSGAFREYEVTDRRQNFVGMVKQAYSVDIDTSPVLIFIQGIVSTLFGSSSKSTELTYGYSDDVHRQIRETNNQLFWTQKRIQTNLRGF